MRKPGQIICLRSPSRAINTHNHAHIQFHTHITSFSRLLQVEHSQSSWWSWGFDGGFFCVESFIPWEIFSLLEVSSCVHCCFNETEWKVKNYIQLRRHIPPHYQPHYWDSLEYLSCLSITSKNTYGWHDMLPRVLGGKTINTCTKAKNFQEAICYFYSEPFGFINWLILNETFNTRWNTAWDLQRTYCSHKNNTKNSFLYFFALEPS